MPAVLLAAEGTVFSPGRAPGNLTFFAETSIAFGAVGDAIGAVEAPIAFLTDGFLIAADEAVDTMTGICETSQIRITVAAQIAFAAPIHAHLIEDDIPAQLDGITAEGAFILVCQTIIANIVQIGNGVYVIAY